MESMYPAMVLLGIVGAIVGAVLFLGWIVPLIVGIVRRRKGMPGFGLILFGCIWAVLSVCLGGLAAYAILQVRQTVKEYREGSVTETDEEKTSDSFSGPEATIALPTNSALTVSLRPTSDNKLLTLVAGNGAIRVPAGSAKLKAITVTATDGQDRTWKASCRMWEQKEVSAAAGGVTNMALGPPFAASVRISWSAASRDISLLPLFADGEGNHYEITCSKRNEGVPKFQFVDAGGNVLWSGKFEFG